MIIRGELVLLAFSGICTLGATVPTSAQLMKAPLSIRPSHACHRALVEIARARARPMQSYPSAVLCNPSQDTSSPAQLQNRSSYGISAKRENQSNTLLLRDIGDDGLQSLRC